MSSQLSDNGNVVDTTKILSPKDMVALSHEFKSHIWDYKLVTLDKNNITIGSIAIAIIFLIFGLWYLSWLQKKLRRFLATRLNDDKDSANALENIISYFMMMIYIVFVMQIAHIPLSAFGFVGGALAISVGLGAQNLISNFIASLIIMIEKPIKIGDFIKINDVVGEVKQIGTRCVTIETDQMNIISIPNNLVIEHNLTNWTTASPDVKGYFDINFYKNYNCWLKKNINNEAIDDEERKNLADKFIQSEHPSRIQDQIEDVLEKMKEHNVILSSIVYFSGIDDFCYRYRVCFECDKNHNPDLRRVRSDINSRIVKKFDPQYITLQHY